jgi:hypothetical protein
MLRYRFILDRTTKAQGDAEKTSAGFANQTKRLLGNLRDLAVGLGKELLPGAAGFLQTVNKLAKELKGPLVLGFRSIINAVRFLSAIVIGLVEGFRSLGTTAKIVLGAIAFFAAAFLAPWLLVPIFIGAAVTAAVLLLEDLWLAVSTGEGVLAGLAGEFQHQLENTDSWAEAMGEIFKTSIDWWGEMFGGFGDTTEMLGLWLVEIFDNIGQGIDNAIQWVTDVIDSAIQSWIDFFGVLGDRVGLVVREMIVWVDEISKKITEFLGGGIEKAIGLASKLFGAIGDLDKTFGLAGPENIVVPGSPAARAAAARAGDVNASQTIEVNVSAPGGDPKAIAGAVAPAVGRAAGDAHRRTAQQLLVGGATP